MEKPESPGLYEHSDKEISPSVDSLLTITAVANLGSDADFYYTCSIFLPNSKFKKEKKNQNNSSKQVPFRDWKEARFVACCNIHLSE